MPQAHYAYPEMLIVLASIWLVWKFIGLNMRLSAAGSVMFGLAAALGVYRFLSGQISELAEIHQAYGQLGGTAGLGLFAVEIWRRRLNPKHKMATTIIGLSAWIVSTASIAINPPTIIPLFFVWSIIFIIGAGLGQNFTPKQRILFVSIAAIMLLDTLIIRPAPWLSPAQSWHFYHVIIAIWLVILYRVYSAKPAMVKI